MIYRFQNLEENELFIYLFLNSTNNYGEVKDEKAIIVKICHDSSEKVEVDH